MLLISRLYAPVQVEDAQQKDILEHGDPELADPELANPKLKGLGHDYPM